MNNKIIKRVKRIISGIVAAVMAVTMLPQIPAFAETSTATYSYDGYDVEYSVLNEWDNGQSVEVKVTNTGDESILNWALKCDVNGEMSDLWNASVYENQGEDYIIKNNGWNYEIAPGASLISVRCRRSRSISFSISPITNCFCVMLLRCR